MHRQACIHAVLAAYALLASMTAMPCILCHASCSNHMHPLGEVRWREEEAPTTKLNNEVVEPGMQND